MNIVSTEEAAETMLKTQYFYNAALLGKKLGITAKKASGLLFNIRQGKKYETLETSLPNRTVKIISICGRRTNQNDLWRLALGQTAARATK